jgi:hypothetical protein
MGMMTRMKTKTSSWKSEKDELDVFAFVKNASVHNDYHECVSKGYLDDLFRG